MRWVIAGTVLEARMWARSRHIGLASVLPVAGPADTFRLRGLPAASATVVRLRPVGPELDELLRQLVERGAATRDRDWWPAGGVAEPACPGA